MRKWVPYMLVVLIALQSVLAVADSHEEHHSDTDPQGIYHSFTDTEDGNSIADQLDAGLSSADSIDCHHNHCPHFNSIVTPTFSHVSAKGKVRLLSLSSVKPNYISSSLGRPP